MGGEIGCYNPLETRNVQCKSFATEAAMLEQWTAGRLDGVVCVADPGNGAKLVGAAGTEFIVALDKQITDSKYAGRICGASPEQRDCLGALLGDQVPSDIKLLTQQQYLENADCVDVYVTAVQQPSRFLSALQRPVYVKSTSPASDATFPADTYPTTYNIAPVVVQTRQLQRWE